MTIINYEALSHCIRDAVRAELQQHLKTGGSPPPDDERLLSKQELAAELGVSLVTLTDWMKKGLPFLRLHKRVYFKKSEVLAIMQQKTKDQGGKDER
ncbi:helix-turn-helix domain-containing protein [Mucilaginibacter rubeus]|uniref:Helix-turn-helix domain-containing protein n=1 Tax=Mucilaginibacter rubeus TaxID=2027860 RepID=A0AAE6JCX7_9SPHI|nr:MULTISPECIES: helix-turn-helix domain-containing protein [Mucilaginibacter]QEM03136.1 helix-turn-helix domain-containing protein [Mucilaginibacter rubeus]QEM15754.1 helix-turn-helix domain-containing protein [Mucilaginibacter gossypii]QTE41505.1 helix-turn-helix domain-containing protein [Mucilaginibacter rubeus]QTE48111.1 helix-turn-helix domain-containing protein [Mucilaginibacter rubeus]QTE59502.1 helix-turn-helix domain-containing protein [Mucilaginibacter rubeus]